MEGNKGQSIFLSVVGVATLLVAIVGATFAYFSISVTGNETASSIQVTTAIVGGVTFADGNDINVTEIYPGWSATKTFTVANTTANSTDQIKYNISLNVTTNTLTDVANNQFVHQLSGTSSNTGTLVSVAVDTIVPTTTTTFTGDGILNGTDTHTYTYKIDFKEANTVQDTAQGKTFAGVLQVSLADGQGLRTYNAENGWQQWTAPTP